MADKNFGQFTNQTSPATGDFVVGYRGTNEQRYTLHAVSGLIVGAGAGGSSLWSENGNKIYYNTDNVGIGTTNPAALLHVSGNQYQVQISGPDGQSKYIKINSSLGDNYIGFDETQNALMMLADNDAPVYIGQVGHQAIRVDKNGDRGSVVIGDDASRPAAGDEVLTVRNTGSSAGPTMTLQNNTTFGGDLGIRYEHVGIDGNSWIQGRYDSDSSFRFAYKDGNDAVLGTNDILTLATGGSVGIGTTTPDGLLHISGNQYQVQISGPDGQSKYIKINSSLGDNYIGFDETQNALMMLADNDAPVYIGQVGHQAIRVDKNGDRGSVVIGDDASRPAAGDEVLTVRNTGSSAGPTMTLQNNTTFGGDLGIRYEHVGIDGNSWIQGRYDSDSSFRIAFTGGQDAVLGTNDIIVVTTGGSVQPQNSGTRSIGASDKAWGSGYFDKLYVTGAAGWIQVTGAGGGGGDSSPLTTKGDLYGFDTDNARIPVGSDGQVLTADSTQSLGVKWADSAAGCAISDWVEAFEEDSNGDLMPVSSNCVNDTMWRLNSDNSLSLRSNHFRYNWGAAAFTEDVSF